MYPDSSKGQKSQQKVEVLKRLVKQQPQKKRVKKLTGKQPGPEKLKSDKSINKKGEKTNR